MIRSAFFASLLAAPLAALGLRKVAPVVTSGLAQVKSITQPWSVMTVTGGTGSTTAWYVVGADGSLAKLGDTQWTYNL